MQLQQQPSSGNLHTVAWCVALAAIDTAAKALSDSKSAFPLADSGQPHHREGVACSGHKYNTALGLGVTSSG